MDNLILGSTKIYGCIADPIEHVRAPSIFTSMFRQRKIDAVMIPIHAVSYTHLTLPTICSV